MATWGGALHLVALFNVVSSVNGGLFDSKPFLSHYGYSDLDGGNTTCSSFSSCSTCTSSSLNSCTWCSDSSKCADSDTATCSQSQITSTCDETIYTIIFIVVLCVLTCLCCAGCYYKRRRSLQSSNPHDSGMFASTNRSLLFRNSLLSKGEKEWMCVICGFDNHPRNKDCNMCGTSHAFSIEYKAEKKEKKKLQYEKRKATLAAHQKRKKQSKPILYPDDASISSHQVLSLSSESKYNKVILAGSTHRSRILLSPEQRSAAVNYRRLNQLTLRQKSARRRKMWQRVFNATSGTLEWVRLPVSDVFINNAPFGYTPRHSFSESNKLLASYNLGFSQSAGSALINSDTGRILLEAAASEPSNGMDGSSVISSSSSTLLHGNVVIPGITSLVNSSLSGAIVSSSPHRGNTVNTMRSREHSGDSFGDHALLSSSPGFTSVLDGDGNLNWERVDSQVRMPSKANKGNASSAPKTNSAGPSPWSRVFSRSSNPSTNIQDSQMTTPLLEDADNSVSIPISNIQEEIEALLHDLETIASLSFKEKQLWFIDRMCELQESWSEGCIRIDVHRTSLLNDSVRAIVAIKPEDLHKYMRIQFVGEPGIDAGGLEREWFELVTRELFNQQRGLFQCSAGDASGGSYHINPISGLLISEISGSSSTTAASDSAPSAPSSSSRRTGSSARTSQHDAINHLDYYKFAGRLIGKALMAQQPIPATLSLPLRKQILTTPITFSDLEFVDSDLYRNLVYLLDECEDVSALDMDFTVTYRSNGKTLHCNLIENGETVIVTNENKDLYLQQRLRHRMFDSIRVQLQEMLKGIYEVIPPDLLSIFDYQELDMLLCGLPDINVEDWKAHTEYIGEYARSKDKHRVIKWFWKAVEAMSREERVRLLQFVTGCGRLPVQGFKALQSNDGNYRKFNIQSISKKSSLYPRAHTCFNKLDLPLYDNAQELDAYLSIVINMEVTGFTME